MSNLKDKIAKLPGNPGVYIFLNAKGKILYIGKATNLKSRVGSYFRGTETRDHIESMMPSVADVNFQETDSVLEALILESNLIKKYQPKYNVIGKDDKSFSYFVITKEEFPRVIILRKTDIEKVQSSKFKVKSGNSKLIRNSKFEIRNFRTYGPYTSKKQMQIALKIMRKIFPFHSNRQNTEKGCLDFQIGLCPGPYADAITRTDYLKNIRNIRMILEGKKKSLIKRLGIEMRDLSKKNEFEKAAEVRNKVFALKHIRDVALMGRDFETEEAQITNYKSQITNKSQNTNHKIQNTDSKFRIEAYDISNISGQYAVGSMVVFENGEPNKNEYRKFKIKTVEGSNDVGMMAEVLFRRFRNDWPKPDLILLDGGAGHLHMGEKVLKELSLKIPMVAVAKGIGRKNVDCRLSNVKLANDEIKKVIKDKKLIKQIMDEAHRFAITYHKKLRWQGFTG